MHAESPHQQCTVCTAPERTLLLERTAESKVANQMAAKWRHWPPGATNTERMNLIAVSTILTTELTVQQVCVEPVLFYR